MIRKPAKSDQRTEHELRAHYEVEKSLANKLRTASSDERLNLYTALYEELYRLVPNHPQLTQKKSPEHQRKAVKKQMGLLSLLLDKNKSFIEVGPGDCALAFHVCSFVKQVYAVDVSKTITKFSSIPENFTLLISDGCSIPVEMNSIDIIYSNQLMEHLHPDDASAQLKNILIALRPGGTYLCITPSSLNGPHDISRYFDTVATGFHLKEYTIKELSELFYNAGFESLILYVRIMNSYIKFPVFFAILLERILQRVPYRFRQVLVSIKPFKALMKIHLVGVKGDSK